jgi:hypothetical protein
MVETTRVCSAASSRCCVEVLLALAVERHLLGLALGHGMTLADLFLQRLGGLRHHAHFVVHVRMRDSDGDIFVGDGLQAR